MLRVINHMFTITTTVIDIFLSIHTYSPTSPHTAQPLTVETLPIPGMGGWTSQEPHFGQQRTTAVAMGFDAMDRRRESVKQIECGQGQHLHVNVGFKLVGKVFDLKSLAAL